jgi:hypothetical protein
MCLALRRTAAGIWVSFSRLFAKRRGSGFSAPLLAAAVGFLALQGCTPLSVPDAALLKPQAAPRCDFRADGKARRQPGSPGPADTSADAAAQAKLDYERQCYRHAELIARGRLHKLQEAVQETIEAAKRNEKSGRDTAIP